MAWCLMAPSHYLNKCWLRSISLYGARTSKLTVCLFKISSYISRLSLLSNDYPSKFLDRTAIIWIKVFHFFYIKLTSPELHDVNSTVCSTKKHQSSTLLALCEWAKPPAIDGFPLCRKCFHVCPDIISPIWTSFLFPNSKSGYSTVLLTNHYSEIIISTMISQVTGVSAICSTADQRKYESTVSLAFLRRIHWWPVDSPHKRPVMQKMFPFDDVLMHITQKENSGSLGNLCNFLWGSPPIHLNCVLYWCTLELHIYWKKGKPLLDIYWWGEGVTAHFTKEQC